MKPRYTTLVALVQQKRAEVTKPTNNQPAQTGQRKENIMSFSVSDLALMDAKDFNVRESGRRYGEAIEGLKAEVAQLDIPAVMNPAAVAFLIARWKGVQGAFFQCLDTDRAAQGLCEAVRNLIATGTDDLDAEGADWKSQHRLASVLIQNCLEIPKPLQNINEELRLACQCEWPEKLFPALLPVLLWEFGRHRP